jgi:hypothetical protein
MAIQQSVNLKTRTGNLIVPTFGGVQIGLIQSVRLNDDYSPEPASGVGDIHVQEYVPTMARHSLSVQVMALNAGAMIAAGIAAENGDAMLKGLVFDIEVYSKTDGALLRKYVGCSYASGDIEISKHAIVMQSGQFNALDVQGTTM